MEQRTTCYRVLEPGDIQTTDSHDFAQDVLIGLSQEQKSLPSKYFYDEEGSRLFQEIMKLPEYYLTACEFEILGRQRERILEWIGAGHFNLVELGAGDGQKTKVLLEHFLDRGADFQYVPVDICEEAVDGCVRTLNGCLAGLESEGLVSEYFDGLKWLSSLDDTKNVVLFLGSNIGNFRAAEAMEFLHKLWNALSHDDMLLIGFDLMKEIDAISRAYNDSAGVTAAFNLNLLKRINRELGGCFNPDDFFFHSAFNIRSFAIESFLVSRKRQQVFIGELNQTFSFDEWEPIHTEFSHKYRESDIGELAEKTGFEPLAVLKDTRGYFADAVWRVRKTGPPDNP